MCAERDSSVKDADTRRDEVMAALGKEMANYFEERIGFFIEES